MARGYGADMGWLQEDLEIRGDARSVHPDTKSVVVLGVSYWTDTPGYLEQPPAADEGWIARYAQGRDYHHDVRKMLIALVRSFEADPLLAGHGSKAHRLFTDTGPVLEKDFAQRAGVGWIGKHSLVINQQGGSWFFLGIILTPLELDPDTPATDHCGTCTRCMDACPTDAFAEPYVLDARRCIAHWTIEAKDPVEWLDPDTMGQHVFGCDICQEVCPWNRQPLETSVEALRPRPENVRPRLVELAAVTDAGEQAFRERFPRSAVRRADAGRMRAVLDAIEGRAD